ncbi:MAG: tRNA (N6-threonylcarbamoyladenosine(37)-N6)-methyltransferase TrmO [Deltaproteobacteria bacterium]|nr:tRNA (N6-threonylcarbamoyladenosine(37)-N6)-methyltransferase TrmO [Deltaproteobacteria bacterium]
MNEVVFHPIGYVKSPEKHSRPGSFNRVVSQIILSEHLAAALEGLSEFSHVEVIYFMHLLEPGRGFKLKVRPRGLPELDEVGLFATRSPNRPNGIGLTLCVLLSIERHILTVKGLDALDGSPVIDIKGPARSNYLRRGKMKFPKWTEALERIAD